MNHSRTNKCEITDTVVIVFKSHTLCIDAALSIAAYRGYLSVSQFIKTQKHSALGMKLLKSLSSTHQSSSNFLRIAA